jgi:hypothetical protein
MLRKTSKEGLMKIKRQLSMVAHTYNPSYLGEGNQEDSDSRPALGKS